MKKFNVRDRVLLSIIFVLAVVVIAGGVNSLATSSETNTMNNAAYSDIVSKTYDFRFGQNPFAPSNATTSTGKFIAGSQFISSSRCASCHTDVHTQWERSAHRNSFREPFYQKNVNDLIEQKNIAHTRHCESCHNPAALFSGALTDKPAFKERPFDEDGVSCMACHSIESVNGKGIGGYVMNEPAMLVKEDGTRLLSVTDQQIIDDVPSHRRAMMRPVLKTPEFCGACHKSQVPKELNDYKFLRAFAVSDELQMSSFSKESPHPFYVRNQETCNSCHMQREAAIKFDVSAKKGTIVSHRWAAANTAIPYFYGWQDQLDAVKKFLENDVIGIDIFAMYKKEKESDKEDFIAPVNRSNFTIKNGDSLTVDVIVTNKNMGHSFPPELRDFYEAYIEFNVADANGKILFSSGYIKPNGYIDESAHNYKTYLVTGDGGFNDKHHIWKTKAIAQNNQIQSGRSDVARYRFTVPQDVSGKLKMTAKLQYRRFTRVFSDYVLGKSVDYPIVLMASKEQMLNVGENNNPTTKDDASTDWRRWNNYGIALLDQRQFAASASAFAQVAELDEKYRAFALTNRALALMELDNWDAAAKLINEALKLEPQNFRAIFQRGRINRVKGKLDEAEKDFRAVNAVYPRDRITLQQLGELMKIKRDNNNARSYYEQILKIDPEDAGAHYNLMLIYSKLGMKTESKQEAKIFADLKDDPAALSIASDFLRSNPQMKNLSVPYHIIDLKPYNELLQAFMR